MRFIEIELEGTVCRAQLNDDLAPKTCDAIWTALPFEGRAVHAQISGDMFRMLDLAPVPELELESAQYFQHPGSVVFYPPIKEIAFCIGEARFAATTGFYKVTPLAEIEGDLSEWTTKGDALQLTGARPIRFRRAPDQVTPFRYPAKRGRKVEIDFDGVRLTATLLEESHPGAARAFAKALPLKGQATNSAWAGAMTRFWVASDPKGRVMLDTTADEPGTVFHWPGYVYYGSQDHGVRICYGDAAEGVCGQPMPLVPLARIDGSVAPYAEKARSQLMEGAKPMSVRLLSA
jgi:hypothetical protein